MKENQTKKLWWQNWKIMLGMIVGIAFLVDVIPYNYMDDPSWIEPVGEKFDKNDAYEVCKTAAKQCGGTNDRLWCMRTYQNSENPIALLEVTAEINKNCHESD